MTPAGIEPATFLFVAQHLNHCATAVPYCFMYTSVYYLLLLLLFQGIKLIITNIRLYVVTDLQRANLSKFIFYFQPQL